MANRLLLLLAAGFTFGAAACGHDRATAAAAGTTTSAATPFVIIYKAGPKWRPGVPMRGQRLRDHFYYWKALDEDGRVIIAGPLGADGGLILLHARHQEEADKVIATDPAVVAGVFVGEARPFIPRFVGAKPLSSVAP